MKSDFFAFLIILVLIFLLGIVWSFLYSKILNHKRDNGFRNRRIKHIAVQNNLFKFRPVKQADVSNITCSIVLSNTDEVISDALKYIKPSKYADSLLEGLYEQTRI